MKTLRRVLIGAAVLVLLAGAVAVLTADHWVRAAVERRAGEALGVDVEVARADVGIFSSPSSISGLRVRNPQGFESTHFATAQRVEIEASMLDLLGDPVRIERMRLQDLDVHLERRGGNTNYGVILDNLRRYRRTRAPDEGKRFLFDVVEVRDITARVNLLAEAGELARFTVDLPVLTLQDVGSGRGGAAVGQLTDLLVTTLVREALAAAGRELPQERVRELTRGVEERVREVGRELGEEIERRIRKATEPRRPADGGNPR